MSKVFYILVNAAGERLYQYPMTEYIDVAERYKRDWYSKHNQAVRIATQEVNDSIAATILSDKY